ncbi:glycine-rich domain-containing protein [Cellvibrio sp. OA-2007]|uniref:glycine-rich domain-containing protein n=1 Tax=Cellvibrio sp. OA-2007 TaxID=529823 RepID=UPI0007828ABE|nr:hypothetical protein [Cellvibrio sp. OA-2007]
MIYLILGMVLLFTVSIFLLGAKSHKRTAYITAYQFPRYIQEKLGQKHPHLNPAQLSVVQKGMRQYFLMCLNANKRMVAMPSQVVDDYWHEFILNTKAYREFCRSAFGRYLDHVPAEAMRNRTRAQDGIKRAWRLACTLEHINPQNPTRLPLIFVLDSLLSIADGFRYSLDCEKKGEDSGGGYCASHIGCGGGCSGSSGGCGSDGGGCGGGGD